jgi:hypothetical protein
VIISWSGAPRRVKTGEVAALKKQLKRINIFAGFCLAAIGGVFGMFSSGFSLEVLTSPSMYIAKLILSLYCLYFGMMILMFELSNSPKVNRFFRENFGAVSVPLSETDSTLHSRWGAPRTYHIMMLGARAGFYMTFGGRSAFFIGVGLFASGSGNAGLSGLILVLDAFYHFYVVSRNPGLRQSIHADGEARLAGESTGDDSGMFTKMANMAAEVSYCPTCRGSVLHV